MNDRQHVAVVGCSNDVLVERLRTAASLSVLDAPDGKPAVAPDCLVCTDDGNAVTDVVETLAERYPDVPIVVVAEDGSERLATRVLGAGADDYVLADDPDAAVERIEAAIADTADRGTTDGGAEREEILAELYDATQELLLAATPEAIADIAVRGASEVLELPITSVYLLDDDGEQLRSAAATDGARELFDGTPPSIPVDDSAAGTTCRTGETRVFEDVRESPDAHNDATPVRTEIQVPIGECGVLLTGARERKEFARYQIDFLELLATAVEAALRRSEREAELRRYETVFRTIDDRVAVLDADGHVRMANERLQRMLAVEELRGDRFDRFLDDGTILQDRIETLDGGESTTVEVVVTAADDRRYPCELGVVSLPNDDGVVCAVRDISERKRIQAELKAERNRFVQLFEAIPDAAVELRFDGEEPTVVTVNEAFERTFGADAESAAGQPLSAFVAVPDTPGNRESTQVDIAGTAPTPTEAEVRRETESGIRDFLFRRVPVEAGDEPTEAFGIYTDITDQRTRQRRLEVLNRFLRHNLRNDLNVVLAAAGEVATAGDPSACADHAATIAATAEDLRRLGEQVRTVESALDQTTRTEPVPIDRVVGRAAARAASHDDIEVATSIPDGPLPAIDERLRIALEQVLDDIRRHCDGGAASVELTVRPVDEGVSVTIVDGTEAIPDPDWAAVERGEETPLEHGSGLGLWLVDWLVTTIGGRVQIEDGPGGTVIEAFLPSSVLEESRSD